MPIECPILTFMCTKLHYKGNNKSIHHNNESSLSFIYCGSIFMVTINSNCRKFFLPFQTIQIFIDRDRLVQKKSRNYQLIQKR